MSLRDFFLNRKKSDSAATAKQRLQVLVAHDRTGSHAPSYLPQLQKELVKVIRKYVPVGPQDVNVSLERDDQQEILELNIVLPDSGHKPG